MCIRDRLYARAAADAVLAGKAAAPNAATVTEEDFAEISGDAKPARKAPAKKAAAKTEEVVVAAETVIEEAPAADAADEA